MRTIEVDRQIINVEDGQLSTATNAGTLLSLAESYLEGENGRFNNDEIYPDRDLAIAEFLAETLGGVHMEE
jgi:hypothetical protein